MLVVESVSLLQTNELVPDDTGEGWAQQSILKSVLQSSSHKQVNIVNIIISSSQQVNVALKKYLSEHFLSSCMISLKTKPEL